MMKYGRIMCVGMALAAVCVVGCGPKEIAPTKAISELSLPADKAAQPAELAEEHFVTKWLVLGPFTFGEDDFGGGHQQAAADNEFMPDESALNGTQEAPEPAAWKETQFADDGQTGRVNLDKAFGRAEHIAAYAVCWLSCPEAVSDAKLLIGCDDYIKVWINGKLVHTYKTERRAGEADQDEVEKISLKKGYNRVVVKCVDVVANWNFFFRLTDKDGKPIAVKAAAEK